MAGLSASRVAALSSRNATHRLRHPWNAEASVSFRVADLFDPHQVERGTAGNRRALVPWCPMVTNAPSVLAKASGARLARYDLRSSRGVGFEAIKMIQDD